MIPQSIASTNTLSLDKTYEARLANLNIQTLIIDIETEKDPVRLEMWLDMLGVDVSRVNILDMSEIEKRNFMQVYRWIVQHSGTEESIISLCKVLGATDARVETNWELYYNDQALYNDLYVYDEGKEYQKYSIDVLVSGVLDMQAFETKYRYFFATTQPSRLYVREVRAM